MQRRSLCSLGCLARSWDAGCAANGPARRRARLPVVYRIAREARQLRGCGCVPRMARTGVEGLRGPHPAAKALAARSRRAMPGAGPAPGGGGCSHAPATALLCCSSSHPYVRGQMAADRWTTPRLPLTAAAAARQSNGAAQVRPSSPNDNSVAVKLIARHHARSLRCPARERGGRRSGLGRRLSRQEAPRGAETRPVGSACRVDGANAGRATSCCRSSPSTQAVLGGKANPTEDDVKKILGSGARREGARGRDGRRQRSWGLLGARPAAQRLGAAG
jgi:hypothetical protein